MYHKYTHKKINEWCSKIVLANYQRHDNKAVGVLIKLIKCQSPLHSELEESKADGTTSSVRSVQCFQSVAGRLALLGRCVWRTDVSHVQDMHNQIWALHWCVQKCFSFHACWSYSKCLFVVHSKSNFPVSYVVLFWDSKIRYISFTKYFLLNKLQ